MNFLSVFNKKNRFKMKIFLILSLSIIFVSGKERKFRLPVYENVRDPLDDPKNAGLKRLLFPESEFEGKIVGGEVAELGQFPHQTLQYMTADGNAWYTCGGSLIRRNWVLTVSF